MRSGLKNKTVQNKCHISSPDSTGFYGGGGHQINRVSPGFEIGFQQNQGITFKKVAGTFHWAPFIRSKTSALQRARLQRPASRAQTRWLDHESHSN
jgi:hypothetical protein